MEKLKGFQLLSKLSKSSSQNEYLENESTAGSSTRRNSRGQQDQRAYLQSPCTEWKQRQCILWITQELNIILEGPHYAWAIDGKGLLTLNEQQLAKLGIKDEYLRKILQGCAVLRENGGWWSPTVESQPKPADQQPDQPNQPIQLIHSSPHQFYKMPQAATSEDMIKKIIFNTPGLGEEGAIQALNELKEQLRKEGRYGKWMEENFEKVLSINEKGEKFYDFKKLRFVITPFDAEEFEYLCSETDSSLEKVKGKHVLMLIGNTGAGKSTLIHYLSGSEMQGTKVDSKTGDQQLDHIAAYPVQSADPTLKNVLISPYAESCTRFIQTVQIQAPHPQDSQKNITRFIVDTPGIQDTRSAEIDLANQYGVAQGAKACASVRLVIVLSREDEGSRFSGLKRVFGAFSGMLTNPQANEQGIQFVFNKYLQNGQNITEEQKRLKACIFEANSTLDYTHDKNYRDFFGILTKKVSCHKSVLLAEPLNSEIRRSLLSVLFNNPAIQDPGTAFQMQVTTATRVQLESQSRVNTALIQYALRCQEYDVITRKLRDQKFLKNRVPLGFLADEYQKAIKAVQNDLENRIKDIRNKLNWFKESQNSISEETLIEFQKSQSIVKNLTNAINAVGDAEVPPFNCGEELENVIIGTCQFYQLEVEKADPSQTDEMDTIKMSLVNLKSIQNIFGVEIPAINGILEASQQLCQSGIESIYNKVLRDIEKNDFEQLGIHLNILEVTQRNLCEFLSQANGALLEEAKKKVYTKVQQHYQEAKNIIELLDGFQSKEELVAYLDKLGSLLNLIRSASKQDLLLNLLPSNKFKFLNQDLDEQFNIKFDQGIRAVQTTLKNYQYEQKDQLKVIPQTQKDLELLTKLQESLSIKLSKENSKSYFKLFQDLDGRISSAASKSKVEIHSFCIPEKQLTDRDFTSFQRNVAFIEGLRWLDQSQKNQLVGRALKEVSEAIKNCKEELISRAEECAEDLDELQFLSKWLSRLKGLGDLSAEEYKSLIDKLTAKFSQKLDILQQQSQNNLIQFKCSELNLFIIEIYRQALTPAHFGQELLAKSAKTKIDYESYLERVSKEQFKMPDLTTNVAVNAQALSAMFRDLNQVTEKYEKLSKQIESERIQEQLNDELKQQVS